MRTRDSLVIAALAAGLGGLILPALAQTQNGAGSAPNWGMGRGHGMMSRRGMTGIGMMGSGCAGMTQSMNGGNGRPNSQWRTHRPGNAMPD